MTKFDLENRYTALEMIDLWQKPILSFKPSKRFKLKCKTRGLIAHDRVLTGRIA